MHVRCDYIYSVRLTFVIYQFIFLINLNLIKLFPLSHLHNFLQFLLLFIKIYIVDKILVINSKIKCSFYYETLKHKMGRKYSRTYVILRLSKPPTCSSLISSSLDSLYFAVTGMPCSTNSVLQESSTGSLMRTLLKLTDILSLKQRRKF